jgi:hypothetical protein
LNQEIFYYGVNRNDVWIVVGFAPTLGGLELISRKLRVGKKVELRMNITKKEELDEHSF